MADRSVLRRTSQTAIAVTCTGSSTHFLIATSQPQPASLDWAACPAEGTSTTVSITDVASGDNTVSVWFKSGNGVSSEAAEITVKKQTSFAFSLPASELGASNSLGQGVIDLTPLVWLIQDTRNDVNGANSGAIHLVNNRGEVTRTIRGRYAGDEFGTYVVKLTNQRFAVISPKASVADGTVLTAGSVIVYDTTGTELFRVEGDNAGDQVGQCDASGPGLLELSNGNLLVCSHLDDVGGLVDAGRVQLLNGTTGAVIASVEGDVAGDRTGDGAWFGLNPSQLATGLVMIPSMLDSIPSGPSSVGSLRFMNPTTGVVVSTITGTAAGDQLTYSGIDVLSTGVVVIRSDSYGGLQGRYTFVNPTTGLELSNFNGDASTPFFGYNKVLELGNGNVVLYSGIWGSKGLVRLINGTTGALILGLEGTNFGDQLSSDGVVPLANGNFVILSDFETYGGVTWAGTARLMNGVTGAVISVTYGDFAGGTSLTAKALANGNYAVFMPTFGKTTGSASSATGKMWILNGSTGATISTFDGSAAGDFQGVGQYTSTALPNGNLLVNFYSMDFGGFVDSGCSKLFNGTTGIEINSICGDEAGDQIGGGNAFTPSTGNNVFVFSTAEKIAGVAVGSVRLVNGATGAVLQNLQGQTAGDSLISSIVVSTVGTVALGFSSYDSGGLVDSGRVVIMNFLNGAIQATHSGQTAGDGFGSNIRQTLDGTFALHAFAADNAGLTNVGRTVFASQADGTADVDIYGETLNSSMTNYRELTNGDCVFIDYNASTGGVTGSGRFVLVPRD